MFLKYLIFICKIIKNIIKIYIKILLYNNNNNMSNKPILITKETTKRLIKDIKDILKRTVRDRWYIL